MVTVTGYRNMYRNPCRETLDRRDPRARPATLDRTEAAAPMEMLDPWVRPVSRDCRETSEELDYPAFLVR